MTDRCGVIELASVGEAADACATRET